MVDNLTRNNWIILIIIIAAGIMISTSVFQFQVMIVGVANHIDHIVDQTAKNMTALTVVLIEQQKAGQIELKGVVDNQTREFVTSVSNFTDIIADYSQNNDKNLKNISDILGDIRAMNNSTGS